MPCKIGRPTIILQKVRHNNSNDMAQHPTRLKSSAAPLLWQTQSRLDPVTWWRVTAAAALLSLEQLLQFCSSDATWGGTCPYGGCTGLHRGAAAPSTLSLLVMDWFSWVAVSGPCWPTDQTIWLLIIPFLLFSTTFWNERPKLRTSNCINHWQLIQVLRLSNSRGSICTRSRMLT
jgi:hypothetical protein